MTTRLPEVMVIGCLAPDPRAQVCAKQALRFGIDRVSGHYDMADRVPSSVMRILRGHGHICLIAPDLDLAQILNEWQEVSDRR